MIDAQKVNAKPPRILMLCNNFGKDPASPYLTNELADALVAQGAEVRVGVIDWLDRTGRSPESIRMPSGVEALFVRPRSIRGLGSFVATASKWLGASAFLARALGKTLGDQPIDLMISFSPLVTTGLAIRWAKRRFRCRSFAYITDFFPLHQQAARQIRSPIAVKIGHAIENGLMDRFETIACMSLAGVAYLREHYRIAPNQSTPVLRLWGEIEPLPPVDRTAVRNRHKLPANRPIILFGGQISEGRGIEDLLKMAELARRERPNLLFLLLGQGRLEPLVRDYIVAGGDNVMLHPAVPRDVYLSIAAACDIGLVATIAETGVPTFPSKTIDYLRVGLPVVASVESTTDYRTFVEDNGFGLVVPAGESRSWLDAISRIVDDPDIHATMVRAGRAALQTHFDVANAARLILKEGLGLGDAADA